MMYYFEKGMMLKCVPFQNRRYHKIVWWWPVNWLYVVFFLPKIIPAAWKTFRKGQEANRRGIKW